MKWFFTFITTILIVAVVAALAAPSFIDWNQYKSQIKTIVADQTGLSVDIAGNLDLSLLPSPKFHVQKITLRNDEKDADILKLDEASISIAILPLLSGSVEFNQITLKSPRVEVTQYSDGSQNWQTQKIKNLMEGSKTTEGPHDDGNVSMPLEISVSRLDIIGGHIVYRDQTAGTDFALDDLNTTISSQSLMGPYQVTGGVTIQGRKMDIDIRTQRFTEEFETISLKADVGLPDHNFSASFLGVLNPRDPMDFQGETVLHAVNTSTLLTKENISLPAPVSALNGQDIQMQGILTSGSGEVSFENLLITLNKEQIISGKLGYTGPGKEGKQTIHADLTITKQANLTSFIPVSGDTSGTITPTAKTDSVQAGLLPQSIAVPSHLDVDVSVAAQEVVIGNEVISGLTVNIAKVDDAFTAKMNVDDISGDGSIKVNATMAHERAETDNEKGYVTYHTPTINIGFETTLEDMHIRAAEMSNGAASQNNLENILKTLTASGKIGITPSRLDFDLPSLDLSGSKYELAGGFQYKPSGRGALNIKLAAENLDLSPFMQDENSQTGQTQAKASIGQTVDGVIGLYVMPLDIDYDISFTKLILPEDVIGSDNVLNNVVAKGSFYEKGINIKSLSMSNDSGLAVSASMLIDDIKTLAGVDTKLSVKAKSLKSLLVVDLSAMVPAGVSGPLSALVSMKGSRKESLLSTNITLGDIEMITSGAVKNIIDDAQVDTMDVQLKHPDFGNALALFIKDFKTSKDLAKNVDLFTSLKLDDSTYTLTGLKGNVGPTSVSGQLVADMSAAKPNFSGELALGKVLADSILNGMTPEAAKTSASNSKSSKDVVWSRTAINTEWMHLFNFDLALGVKEIHYNPWLLNDVAVQAKLTNGRLDLTNLNARTFDGDIGVKGTVVSSQNVREPLNVSGNVEMRGINSDPFIRAVTGMNTKLIEGTVDFSTSLKAVGLSPAALIFDLSGDGKMQGQNVIVHGINLDQISNTLSQGDFKARTLGLFQNSLKGGKTKFETVQGNYVIKEGVMNIQELALTSSNANVLTTGYVNLPRWTIDAKTVFDIKEPEDAPSFDAKFTGSLSNPQDTFVTNAMEQFIQGQVKNELFNIIERTIDKSSNDNNKNKKNKSKTDTNTNQQVKPEDAIKGILQNIIQ